MPPVQLSCPGCKAQLRLMSDMLGKQVRCPKCKTVFPSVAEADVVDAPSAAQPAPVPTAPPVTAPAATTSVDKDKAFFEWLADAKDPLAGKPEPPPKAAAPAEQKPPPVEKAEPLPLDDDKPAPARRAARARSASKPDDEPAEKRPDRRARPARRRDEVEEETRRSGNGLLVAVVAAAALFLLTGLAVAAYAAYSYLDDEPESTTAATSGTPAPSTDADKPRPEKPAGPLPDAVAAKTKAATVAVKAVDANGQTSTASGFFVPGPGLVVTNARAVGQGRKPGTTAKLQVMVGVGPAEPRTLTAKLLGADPDLDLALLQVTGFDLPDPLPLGDTLAVKEKHPAFVFAVTPGDGVNLVVVGSTTVTGQRTAAGTRPWFVLGNGVPPGAAGGPVTDAAGRVIGAASQVPGTQTSAAVPAETVQSFVRSAVKSAETGGSVAVTPPGHADTDPKPKPNPPPGADDPPAPGFPGRPEMPRPPRPFDPPVFPQPPVLPPAFNQPGRPPGDQARPPGPPRPKITFPPVNPVEISPTAITKDTVGLTLPGKVSDTCVGGGGRYWLLLLPDVRQLAVFDATAGRVVKYLPVPSEKVRFAAGMNKLVIADPDTHELIRYDLKTFEKELAIKAPFEGQVRQLAMGAASGGPLVVNYFQPGARAFRGSCLTFMDLTTFKELDPGPGNTLPNTPMGFYREPMQYRASPDGKVVTSWGGGEHFWHVYSLSGDGVKVRSQHEMGVVVSPAQDGTLLASNAVYAPDGKVLDRKEPRSVLRVPAQQGPAYLVVSPEREPNAFPDANKPAPIRVTVHMLGDDRPLYTLPDPGVEMVFNFSPAVTAGLPADRRVFFCPAGNLIGYISSADDRLILTRFNLDAALEKSGVDFLFVTSRPPAAEAGTAFRYPLVVKSKKGGVKVRLEAGPAGMAVDGTTVTWDVPKDWAGTERILLSVTDASGQEIFHTFTLAPKGK